MVFLKLAVLLLLRLVNGLEADDILQILLDSVPELFELATSVQYLFLFFFLLIFKELSRLNELQLRLPFLDQLIEIMVSLENIFELLFLVLKNLLLR